MSDEKEKYSESGGFNEGILPKGDREHEKTGIEPEATSNKPESKSEKNKAGGIVSEKKEPESLAEFVSREEESRPDVSLRTILGGDLITGSWFRRQFWFILLLALMAIVYISNRYAYQFELIERKELTDTLHDRRYKALTRSSQLLEKTLRSNVEEDLADSTLQTSFTPSYVIKLEER